MAYQRPGSPPIMRRQSDTIESTRGPWGELDRAAEVPSLIYRAG